MKNKYILLLIISFCFSYENTWSTTRFEYWWNSSFNSMQYREPISFIPYKLKIGKFYYGGNNYIKQVIGDGLNDRHDMSGSLTVSGSSISLNNYSIKVCGINNNMNVGIPNYSKSK